MSISIPQGAQFKDANDHSKVSDARGSQLSRLLQLVLTLQSDNFPNADELARRCEVSRRTIYRDLEILAAAGVMVRYRPDRQGYQLAKSCPVPTPILDEKEVLALLVLTRQAGGPDEFGLFRDARAGAIKIVQGFPPEARNRIIYRAEVVPEQPIASERDPRRVAIHDAILDGLAERRQLRIWSLETDGLSVQCTKLSVYCMVHLQGSWCLIGRSSLHRGVCAIRVCRVQRVEVTGDASVVPPRFSLGRFLGRAWSIERGAVRVELHLRFSARAAPEVPERIGARDRRLEPLDDGRLDVHLVVDGLDEIVGWLLGFGPQLEVISPPGLRDRLRHEAMSIARMYGHSG